jgi:protoporphyrinogen oxidase
MSTVKRWKLLSPRTLLAKESSDFVEGYPVLYLHLGRGIQTGQALFGLRNLNLTYEFFMKEKTAIIIGAGPAGLTAAYELLTNSDVKPIILEMSNDIGGISKTVEHNGNRMDMGGHRFFSKSDRIMNWWLNIMPLQRAPSRDELILNKPSQNAQKDDPDPEKSDLVMLLRRRLSRIYYLRNFFDYPVSLSLNTLRNLGFIRVFNVGISYFKRMVFPIKKEKTLEDFLINRFGDKLYSLFFRDYTEKVWGVKPSQIKPDWGAQRIKGLSIKKILSHALSKIFSKRKNTSVSQKNVETSLIEKFYYPKFGPGQLWEQAAKNIRDLGGEIFMNHRVVGLTVEHNHVGSVQILNEVTGELSELFCDYCLSTMPVRDLIAALGNSAPIDVQGIAQGLVYRDFITVGLLLRKMKIVNTTEIKTVGNIIPDLWLYIQERDVKVGRIQVFNNWSPYLVENLDKIWIGLEYFCTDGDELYSMPEDKMAKFAITELVSLGMIDYDDVLDSIVVKVPKAYPAYFGSYDNFNVIQNYTDTIDNLFLIGRNGQHRYNNMDHSMLTAMAAVSNIISGKTSKGNIWSVNTENDYHEQKSS